MKVTVYTRDESGVTTSQPEMDVESIDSSDPGRVSFSAPDSDGIAQTHEFPINTVEWFELH